MVVASCRVTLHIPEARSLKDKRRVTRALRQRLRERHDVSVSEVDAQDLWQRAVLGLAIAAPDQGEAQARMGRVARDIEDLSGVKYVDFETEFHPR